MEVVISFFSFLQGLGVAVMMPIILTIIGCALGAGFGKSLKAGLMVGVGFIGLNLVINQLFGTAIGPAVQEMLHRFGLTLNVIDVGWPAGAAIALGTTIGLV
ncbi:MAG: PTS sugar transporter subunit IIC, partial [Lancefieldella parvula]|nr:PTS sugar transporter subunit IIC [Lancefieldella parvula]